MKFCKSLLFSMFACASIAVFSNTASAQSVDELDVLIETIVGDIQAVDPSIMLGCNATIPNTSCGCSASGAGSCVCTGTGSATVCTCTDSTGTMTCKLVGGACNCTSTPPATPRPRPRPSTSY